MAKLYFRHATVNSGKSARLAIEVHNDRLSGRRVLVFTAAIDDRAGRGRVVSRVPGLELQADAAVAFPGDILVALRAQPERPDFIYCDESQFYSRDCIEMLRDIATFEGIPVMCYGLRTDWKLGLFEGSAALFALADEFQEIKSMCSAWDKKCKRKAFSNTKHRNRQPVLSGPQVEIGAEDHYCAMCYQHHVEFTTRP
jgi:thymidine kinase